MQKLPKIFVIIATIILIGGIIGWLAGKGKRTDTNPQPSSGGQSQASPTDPVTISRSPEIEAAKSSVTNGAEITVTLPPGPVTNWEEKLEEILGAEMDDTNKVALLFEMFPRVPDEARAEIAQHLSNLVTDENYAPLGELLNDPKLVDTTLDILMQDVLNRANSLKLPQLLIVAKTPDHPKAEEAKDILALFLDEDFGTDWNIWEEKMKAWLKDNPD
jgi:hypothetical protein